MFSDIERCGSAVEKLGEGMRVVRGQRNMILEQRVKESVVLLGEETEETKVTNEDP